MWVQLYQRAAQSGHAGAQYRLAEAYRTGEGIAKDPVKADQLYRKTAETGHIRAQYMLAVSYRTNEDYVMAYKWFSLAGSRAPAGKIRDLALASADNIARRMTDGEIREAEVLARQWMPKTSPL